MNLLILLTTFLLIIATQLLMLHAQGILHDSFGSNVQRFKEKKNERQLSLNDVIRKGEFLTRRKRDADDNGKSDDDDQNSSGSQGIGSQRRGFRVGLSSNILGSRGNLGFNYVPPDYSVIGGNPFADNQAALYRAYLSRNRGAASGGGSLDGVTNGLGKMVSTDINKLGGGLDNTVSHLTDTLEDMLDLNGPESKTGGLLGTDFLFGGAKRLIGNLLHKTSHNLLHNALQDTSHLTHALLDPDENGNLGGSIGFQGSVGGSTNPALQYYLLHNGYYNS